MKLLTHWLFQLDSRKTGLEIELNESLRRRRAELQAKIEALSEAGNSKSTAADTLNARVRELKSIDQSIQALTKKLHGQFSPFKKPRGSLMRNERLGKGGRKTCQ